MTTTKGPDIVNGLITNWIPLTTPGPGSLLRECSSAIYYLPGAVSEWVVFDPYYGKWIDTAIKCLATEQSLWWNQHSDGVTTDINLGPFNCPTGYTTATTSSLNGQSTFVGCCPSGYLFQGSLLPAATLGQCRSPLSVGQTITAKSAVSGFNWYDITAVVESVMSIDAVHINGFIFADAAAEASPASASASTTSIGPTPTSASIKPSNTQSTGSSAAGVSQPAITPVLGGLSGGAKIGIGVGVILATLGILSLCAALFILKRRSRSQSNQVQNVPNTPGIAEAPSHIPLSWEANNPRLNEAPSQSKQAYKGPVEMWVSPSRGG